MNLRRCRHVEIGSLRLFNVANSGLVFMKCFSVVHKLHCFVRFEYLPFNGEALFFAFKLRDVLTKFRVVLARSVVERHLVV